MKRFFAFAIIPALIAGWAGDALAGKRDRGAELLPDSGVRPDSPDPASRWLQDTRAVFQAVDQFYHQEVSGRVFYVSTTGSDDDEGAESSPWASIRHAVSRLRAGDTLYILEGTYTENIAADLQVSGREDAWITIQGIGNVVIDGIELAGDRLASDPIRGDRDLEHIVEALGDKAAYHTDDAFNTNGQRYIRFRNLTVNRMRSAVNVSEGSSFIEIDGLRTDGNRFAVRVDGASDVSVRDAVALNSWNAFRAEGDSRRLFFENIEARGSKDVWDGMNPDYLNGDGFILEAGVRDVVMRHIVSADNWDAGFDIKASGVLMEFVGASGNKNNWKVWGDGITIRNSLSHHAKSQERRDGSTVEGNGITVEAGARNILLQNVTLADSENYDIRVYGDGELRIEDSIVANRSKTASLFRQDRDTSIRASNVLWYGKNKNDKSRVRKLKNSSGNKWTNPKFENWSRGNYLLSRRSWAWGRAPGGGNLGAYEYQGTGGEAPGLLYPLR